MSVCLQGRGRHTGVRSEGEELRPEVCHDQGSGGGSLRPDSSNRTDTGTVSLPGSDPDPPFHSTSGDPKGQQEQEETDTDDATAVSSLPQTVRPFPRRPGEWSGSRKGSLRTSLFRLTPTNHPLGPRGSGASEFMSFFFRPVLMFHGRVPPVAGTEDGNAEYWSNNFSRL